MNLCKLVRPFIGQGRHIYTTKGTKYRAWPKPEYGPMEVQRSVLLNGIRVAAAKHLGAEIAACTIMFQAGSRYEIDDQLGVTHFLRTMSNATGCAHSSFAKLKVLQQLGSSITCSTDRQTVAYTLRCPFPLFPDLRSFLVDAACRCRFFPWELDDQKEFMKQEYYQMTPEQRVLDLLQQASFRGPLANSNYCCPERIDAMNDCSVNCFAATNFQPNVLTIGSVGIPFEETMKLAETLERSIDMPCPRPQISSCHRAGYEEYDLGPGADTWVAIAVPGCGTSDVNCLLRHAVVAAACGVGDIQSGQHVHDRTPMSPLGTMAGGDIYTQYRAFNLSYQDTGLFGILIKSKACGAWSAVMAAAEFLTNVGDLNFDQINVGKKRLQLRMALNDEDCVLVAEGLALQSANNVKIDSHKDWITLIENLTPEEVSCTAKAISGKHCCMSVAVVGDVTAVPNEKDLLYCK